MKWCSGRHKVTAKLDAAVAANLKELGYDGYG